MKRNGRKNVTIKKSRLWYWPFLLLLLCLVDLIILYITRNQPPLNWFGRNGLSLTETLWDTDVFWGEFWWNLLIILLLSLLLTPVQNLLKKSTINQKTIILDLSLQKRKKLTMLFFSFSLLILLLMVLTWERPFSLIDNWYPTQFANQLVIIPALVGLSGIIQEHFIRKYKINRRLNIKEEKKLKIIKLIFLTIISIIWIFLSLITYFHPHAIFEFGIPIHFLTFTFFFPVLITFQIIITIIQKNGLIDNSNNEKNNNKNGENNKKNGDEDKKIKENDLNNRDRVLFNFRNRKSNNFFIWFGVTIGGLLIIVFLQLYNAYHVPLLGDESVFSTDVFWWWPFSHWPSYLFIITTSLGITFGINIFLENLNNNLLNDEKANPKNSKKKINVRQKSNKKRERKREKNGIFVYNKRIHLTIKASIIIVLILVPGLEIKKQWEQRDEPLILINQSGYLPNSPKQVLFQVLAKEHNENINTISFPQTFQIINDNTNEIIYIGTFPSNYSRYGRFYFQANFDELKEPGTYHIEVNYNKKTFISNSFEISNLVYTKAAELMLRFFYYQRCNYDVKEIVPGYPGHHACHLDDGEVWDGKNWIYKNLTGGWHDAGDYNKYNSWFQTQWYCIQSLAEAAIINPNNLYGNISSLYDSAAPDVIDEALWGTLFLVHSINIEGYQGENYRYLVWDTVSGYNHYSDKESRMSYTGGPPEKDWTTPRRVVFNNDNSTFVSYHRGYQIAATLWHVARMVDSYLKKNSETKFPNWAPINTTYLRDLGQKVYDRYLIQQGNESDGVQSIIGKLYFMEEQILYNNSKTQWSNDSIWEGYNNLAIESLNFVPNEESYALWFGWAGYYLLGNLLTHYLTYNLTIPYEIIQKIKKIQSEHFTNLFLEPFLIKHSIVNGTKVLFYGKERMTDVLTSAWLELLIYRVDSALADLRIIQGIFDWLLGVNPGGYSLIEGLGIRNFPQYHHRYAYARNPRGAVPGAIPNGITNEKANDLYFQQYNLTRSPESALYLFGDKPYFADWPPSPLARTHIPFDPNEVWIPHNAMFIRILTELYNSNYITEQIQNP